jgi:copper homeostasis protein CutC
MPLVEICTDSWESTVRAISAGADRIELCAHLDEEGLTPLEILFSRVMSEFPHTPIFVMIRCRPGDFVYTEQEKEIMMNSALRYCALGADGVVVGALTSAGCVDYDFMRIFSNAIRASYPSVAITFHKAIDLVDPIQAGFQSYTEFIRSLAPFCDRALTSGGRPTAIEGAANIRSQIPYSPIMIAAGKIRAENVHQVIEATGAREIHSRCPDVCLALRGDCS